MNITWMNQTIKVYGPYGYDKEDQRKTVRLIFPDGSRKSMSMTRLCVQYAIDKMLPENIDIDHIDRNHENNDIDNLQYLQKNHHSIKDAREKRYVDITCAVCGTIAVKEWRHIKDNQKRNPKSGPYCSKKCSGKGSHPSTQEKKKKIYTFEDTYLVKTNNQIIGIALKDALTEEEIERYNEILGRLLESVDKTLLKRVAQSSVRVRVPCLPPKEKEETKQRPKQQYKLPENQCKDCYKWISKTSIQCKSCRRRSANQTAIDWPSLEEVLNLVEEKGFVKAGKELGVSDNAIRKFFNRNGIGT